jgi:hypothetical protein
VSVLVGLKLYDVPKPSRHPASIVAFMAWGPGPPCCAHGALLRLLYKIGAGADDVM